MKPKNWNPGVVDEAWKLMIVARDLNQAETAVGWLVSRLTDAGPDTDKGLDQIAMMSGTDIVGALRLSLKARDTINASFRDRPQTKTHNTDP